MFKIYVNRIAPEGSVQEERIDSAAFDLDTDIIKFKGQLHIKAALYKITNALTVDLEVKARAVAVCARCLEEFELPVENKFQLAYDIQRPDQVIDLTPEIREEIILGYAIQPLCSAGCKGLCARCGDNLNKGACKCVSG